MIIAGRRWQRWSWKENFLPIRWRLSPEGWWYYFRNRHEEKKNRLVLSVFAREVEFVEDDDENMKSNASLVCPYTYANRRCTGKPHLAEKSQIFWSPSTGRMENRTISHASAGAEMPDMHLLFRWVVTSWSGAGSRAGNTWKKSVKKRRRSGSHTRFL